VAALVLVVGAGSFQTPAGASLPVLSVTVPPAATVLTCPGPLELPAEVGGGGDAEFSPVPVAPVTRLTTVGNEKADRVDVRRLDGTSLLPTDPDTADDLEPETDSSPDPVDPPNGDHTGDPSVDPALAPGSGAPGSAAPGSSSPAVGVELTAPAVVRVAPRTGGAPADGTAWLAAATTMVMVTAGDLRGLAGASCQPAGVDQWLVGGATDDGSTAHLVLVNPGTTPARVVWTVWGAGGPVDLTSDQVLVAPKATEVVNLGGPAGPQKALVTHVVASGGQVAAWVQDCAITGFTAAGTDFVVASAPPATRQSVPGLVVEAESADTAGLVGPTLRLLAPGDTDTTAHLQLYGADGPVDLPGVESVALSAGTVLDVPLGGLPADHYTAVVDADVPVVAAATVTRVGLPGQLDPVPRTERALVASTPGGTGTTAVPPDVTATLVVGAVTEGTAEGTGEGTVEIISPTGKVLATHHLSVDSGTTGAWPVANLFGAASDIGAIRVVATSGATLVWAVLVETTQDDGTLATILTPTGPSGAPVAVPLRDDPAIAQG